MQLSVSWVDIVVLVEIVVVIVQGVVTMVPVQVDGVRLWRVDGFESAWRRGHELAEYADAAVPEGGLGQPAGGHPGAGGGVVGLHHVRQLECVVIATGHVHTSAQGRHTSPYVDLEEEADGCSQGLRRVYAVIYFRNRTISIDRTGHSERL